MPIFNYSNRFFNVWIVSILALLPLHPYLTGVPTTPVREISL